MVLDCAIIGGGPSGLNAALVLARAGRNIILFDENKPRNAVTQESHGFITRDGIKPAEFKKLAWNDLSKYPSYTLVEQKVIDITKIDEQFHIQTKDGQSYYAKKIILSTGLKDVLPNIEGIHDFYGKSLYSCPFCDGWEMKDEPLVLIAETDHAYHMMKILFNWSKNLVICTNGKSNFSIEQKARLAKNNIELIEEEIASFKGENGQLEKIIFASGKEIRRTGGIVEARLVQSAPFAKALGCTLTENGGIEVDSFGRTNVKGVYASGDCTLSTPPQVIIAAAEGSKVGAGIVMDLMDEEF